MIIRENNKMVKNTCHSCDFGANINEKDIDYSTKSRDKNKIIENMTKTVVFGVFVFDFFKNPCAKIKIQHFFGGYYEKKYSDCR